LAPGGASIHSFVCSPTPPDVDGLALRLRSIERSQCDQELIIFGLSDGEVDRGRLLESLAGALDIGFSQSDIVNSVWIAGGRSSSRPLVVRFVSVARRNEWLAAARRHRGITARCVRESWPDDRISIYERSTAAERRALAEARSLACDCGVRHVWMRRGVIYYKPSDGSPPRRYSSPDTFARTGLLAEPSDLASSATLPTNISGGVADSPI